MTDSLMVGSPSRGMLAERSLQHRFADLTDECRELSRRALGTTSVHHLAVAPSGVWVVAERRSPGRPAGQGGLLSRRTETLHLGRRNAARLVHGVRRQADAVRDLLGADVPVGALLCILDADWPIFGGAFAVDGVRVLWPKKACDVITAGQRVLSPAEIDDIAERLGQLLPPAAAPRSHTRGR